MASLFYSLFSMRMPRQSERWLAFVYQSRFIAERNCLRTYSAFYQSYCSGSMGLMMSSEQWRDVLVTISQKVMILAFGLRASSIWGAASPQISIMNWSKGSISSSSIFSNRATGSWCSSSQSMLRSQLSFNWSHDGYSYRLRFWPSVLEGGAVLVEVIQVGSDELTFPHFDSFFLADCVGAGGAPDAEEGGGGGNFFVYWSLSLLSFALLSTISLALTLRIAILRSRSSSSILDFGGEGSFNLYCLSGRSNLSCFSCLSNLSSLIGGLSCLAFSLCWLRSLLLELDLSLCFFSFFSFLVRSCPSCELLDRCSSLRFSFLCFFSFFYLRRRSSGLSLLPILLQQ